MGAGMALDWRAVGLGRGIVRTLGLTVGSLTAVRSKAVGSGRAMGLEATGRPRAATPGLDTALSNSG